MRRFLQAVIRGSLARGGVKADVLLPVCQDVVGSSFLQPRLDDGDDVCGRSQCLCLCWRNTERAEFLDGWRKGHDWMSISVRLSWWGYYVGLSW